jgi:hypothetical protein
VDRATLWYRARRGSRGDVSTVTGILELLARRLRVRWQAFLSPARELVRRREAIAHRRVPLVLAAVASTILVSSCTQSGDGHGAQGSRSSVDPGNLGGAGSSVHGVPIPADARPLAKASLATAGGGQTESFLLPGTIADAAIRAWYDRELPAGRSLEGLNECTGDNAFAIVPAPVITRKWAGAAGQLTLNVAELGSVSTIGITVAWDPHTAGYSTTC